MEFQFCTTFFEGAKILENFVDFLYLCGDKNQAWLSLKSKDNSLNTVPLAVPPFFYLSQNTVISKDYSNVFLRKYASMMTLVIFKSNDICGFYLGITRLIRTFLALALLAWFVVASPHFLGLYFDAPPFG